MFSFFLSNISPNACICRDRSVVVPTLQCAELCPFVVKITKTAPRVLARHGSADHDGTSPRVVLPAADAIRLPAGSREKHEQRKGDEREQLTGALPGDNIPNPRNLFNNPLGRHNAEAKVVRTSMIIVSLDYFKATGKIISPHYTVVYCMCSAMNFLGGAITKINLSSFSCRLN